MTSLPASTRPGRDDPAGRRRLTLRSARFSLTIASLSVALAVATLIVILRGDQTSLAPVAVSPEPEATSISTGTSLRLRFARTVRGRSVEERLQLEPPVAGTFQWTGTMLTFTPLQPLQPDTEYRVTLAAGIIESGGRVSREPYRWSFRTRRPAIVTLQSQAGASSLVRLDLATGTARALTSETVAVVDFSLAPDGSRAVYTVQDSPTRTSLRLVDLSSGRTRPVAVEEGASHSAARWSPTGDLIVYERRQAVSGGIANPKLFAVRADGGASNLVYGRGDEVGFGAQWAPDGSRLAFFDSVRSAVVIFNFTRDLVIIPVQTTVTFDWSPDGQHLVIEDIVSERNAFRHILLVASATTGQMTSLSADPEVDEASPAWSPDGSLIAYTRRPTQATIDGAQPWLMRPDGSARRPLIAYEPRVETTRLSWSPDGRQLALERLALDNARAETEVWLVDVAASTAARRLGPSTNAGWLR